MKKLMNFFNPYKNISKLDIFRFPKVSVRKLLKKLIIQYITIVTSREFSANVWQIPAESEAGIGHRAACCSVMRVNQ